MRTKLTFRRHLLTKERLSGGQVRDDEPTSLGEVREEARHALGLIADALAESGTAGWASYGTLLGLVRGGDVIAHDDDLDFAAGPGSDPGALVRSMQARGFSLTEQTTGPQGVTHQKFGFGKIEMDVYYLKMHHGDLVDEWTAYEHSVVHGRHRKGGTILRRFGSLELPIPENPEAYLEVMYGPEWRVPVTRWHPIHSPPNVVLDLHWRDIIRHIKKVIYWRSALVRRLRDRQRKVQITHLSRTG